MSASFHLNNKEVKHELDIKINGFCLTHQEIPPYLGVKLDRTLTYHQCMENLCMKLTSHIALLKHFAGTGWDAKGQTLRIVALSLVYAPAEYCAPIRCMSVHTPLIDKCLKDAIRTMIGCLHPTPMEFLPILSGIQPAELCRTGATISFSQRALN